jgi:hypothetical protein
MAMEEYTETPAQQAMRKALGRACMAASHDRFAEVVTVLEDAIREYGDSPDAWLCQAYRELSEAAAMVGDTEKGLRTAQRALAIHTQIGFSDNPTVAKCEAAHIYRRLALNLFLRKEPRETFQALEKCRLARFFSRRQDWSYRPNSTIYTPALLEAISNCGVATEQILAEAEQAPGTRLQRYPDGRRCWRALGKKSSTNAPSNTRGLWRPNCVPSIRMCPVQEHNTTQSRRRWKRAMPTVRDRSSTC